MNVAVIGLSLVLILIVIFGYQSCQISDLEAKNAEYIKYKEADAQNQTAIAECEAAAEETIAKAEEVRAAMEDAAKRSAKRAESVEQELETLNDLAKELKERVVGTCPAADDPAFIDFVCNGPIGCKGV